MWSARKARAHRPTAFAMGDDRHTAVLLEHVRDAAYRLNPCRRLPNFSGPLRPCGVYFRQKAGVNSTSSVKISRRPRSMAKQSSHLAKSLMSP